MDMRTVMDIVEEGRRAPVSVLFHLTRLETYAKIKRNGLQPSFSQAPTEYPRAVYLADSLEHACGFARTMHKARQGEGYVLLTLPVSALDPALLGADDRDLEKVLADRGGRRAWTEVDWRESLKICGQCTYRGWIKAEHLTVMAWMRVGEGWKAVDQEIEHWEPPAAEEPSRGIPGAPGASL